MINEFGLYRNIKPRYLIPGLRSDRTLDEQTQGWWLPYYDKEGNIHLVDTYHISGIYKGYGNDFLNNFIEDKNNKKDDSFLIGKSNFDYYYGGSVKITPTTEQYFELVCDLRDFTIEKIDPNDYKEEDTVTNVQLYFEHCYPRGCTLLRKGAKKDITREAENFMYKKLDDIRTSYLSDYDVKQIEEYLKDKSLDCKIAEELKATLKYIKRIIEIEDKKNEFRKDYRKEIDRINRIRGVEND